MFIQTAWAASGNNENSGFFANLLENFWLWFAAIILFFFSFFLAAIIKKVVMYRIRKSKSFGMHQEVLLLLERSIYFGVLMVLMVISFQIVGIDLTWVLGAMSFGLGFAFKDILANFIGGIVILTQHKLKIGDLIKVGGKMGRITTIDARTTQIKALDGTEVIIPNSDMVTDVVQNFTANEFRRISLEVGVHYSTPLDDAVNVTLNSMKKNQYVVAEPHAEVLCKDFGKSAILLEVRFWIESTDNWWTIKSQVIKQIKADFDQVGITIPFPIRTLSLDPYDKNMKKALHLD
jgi:small-conductance mechanosensitive channel